MRVLSIDVGSYSIKFCLADVKKNHFKIQRLLKVSIPDQSATIDKQIHKLGPLVKEAIFSNRLDHDRMVLGLPATMCSFRFIEVPFTTRKKIEQVLPFEVEDLVPFRAEELIIDYQHIRKEKKLSELLVAMVPLVNYDNYLSVFNENKVESDVVMPDIVGLSIFCERFLPESEKTTVLIDIGYRHSSMSFIEQGKMVYIRPIPFGYVSFSQHIKEKTNYTDEEVEALIQQYDDYSDEDKLRYQSILDEAFTELVVEVNQTLIAYKTKSKASVGDILVSGGFGVFSYVIPTLGGEFSYPVKSISTLSGSVQTTEEVDLHSFSTAIGYAALYATKSPTLYINFRRKETKAQKVLDQIKVYFEAPRTQKAFKAGLLLLMVLIPYLLFKAIVVNMHFDDSRTKIERLLKKVVKGNISKKKRDKFIEKPDDLIAFIKKDLNEGDSKIQVFQRTHIYTSKLLLKLQRAIPKGLVMDVTDFEFTQEQVKLRVKVIKGNMGAYVEGISKLPEIKNVKMNPIDKGFVEVSFDLMTNS